MVPWYLTRRTVLIALTLFGPLALPLAWLSPRFDVKWKIITTIVTLILAVLFGYLASTLLSQLDSLALT